MVRVKRFLGALVLLLGSVQSASAQSTGIAAVGISASTKIGVQDGTAGSVSPSFLWRYGHGRDGFGFQAGLGWYSAELTQPVGQTSQPFGELHVRPVMVGYGYTLRLPRAPKPRPDTPGVPGGTDDTPRRRIAITGRLLGGYALTKFELEPAFDDAYRRAFNANTLSTHASNAFVVKPELSAWIDVSRKIGLLLSASYTAARPYITVTSSAGSDERHVRADVVTLTVGTVYSVF